MHCLYSQRERRGEGETAVQVLRELLPSALGLPAEQVQASGGMRRGIDPESHLWIGWTGCCGITISLLGVRVEGRVGAG